MMLLLKERAMSLPNGFFLGTPIELLQVLEGNDNGESQKQHRYVADRCPRTLKPFGSPLSLAWI